MKCFIEKIKYIRLISILSSFRKINSAISELVICYFAILGILNYDSKILSFCIGIGLVLWLLQQYIMKIDRDYSNVHLSNSLVVALALYGIYIYFTSNEFFLVYLYFINFSIGKIILLMFNKERVALKKQGVLLHELGHFFITKEYKILNPRLININEVGDVSGRFFFEGNIEDVPTFKFVTLLISGYITENYILHNKKEYSLRELRNVLLVELENRKYSNDYLHDLIIIYLDDNILKEIVNNIIEIVERQREDILNIAKKNRYKKTINMQRCIERRD